MRLLHYADVENAADHPERVARLAGLIRERRDPETVVVGGGDNTAPGVLSLATDGRHALDVFERISPDLDVLGNHDFDHGPEATRAVVRSSPQTWLCANLERDGEPFGKEAGVRSWTVLERGGERLGVFGVTTPAIPEITPPAASLTATDPIVAAREAIEDLRERDPDHVVALSHLGRGDDDLARAVEVDAILGGHVHEPRLERVDGTLIARPGANASGLVEVDLDGRPTVVRRETRDAPVDEALAAALRDRRGDAGLEAVVASVTEPLARTPEELRAGHGRLGTAIAEAYRWKTGADVGLQNTGGIRDGPALVGEVTAADLVSVVPFDEPVAVVELTGRELRSVLRERNGNAVPDLPSGRWHGHASGVSVEWHDDAIESIEVGGDALDPDATYRLATSDYLLGTPHEFPTLAEDHRVDRTDGPQYEVFVEYAQSVGLDASGVDSGHSSEPLDGTAND